jgi:HD-GYP domain-containing protein (c-di-GMP phosphodiesterase class II)
MILSKIDDLKKAAAFVRSHHENFDGSGFPDGLRGERIPLGARMIRVANDYDNLINKRGLSRADALEYLRRKSGSEYDPQIVITLLNVFDQLVPSGAEEAAFLLDELKSGMILSRDIKTNTGLFLLSKNTQIEEQYLERLKNFHRICPIVDMVYVYKSSTTAGNLSDAA